MRTADAAQAGEIKIKIEDTQSQSRDPWGITASAASLALFLPKQKAAVVAKPGR
jgi:hypothetical protein